MGTGSPLGACSFKAANDVAVDRIVSNRKVPLDSIAAPLCNAQQSGHESPVGHESLSFGASGELCVTAVPMPSGSACAIKSPANTDNVSIVRKIRTRL